MKRAIAQHARPAIVIALITMAGIVCAGYVLIHQRAPVPFRTTYDVRVALSAADGVAPGLGQPVLVSGVRVGVIAEAQPRDGNALVTLQIDRDKLPRVHTDARATLVPITPLKDMSIELDPGSARAPVLSSKGAISASATRVPIGLDELLSSLDSDTRAFAGSLIASAGRGLGDRGVDLRAALKSLGPTTAQLGRLSRGLETRRARIARLVHNVARLTAAASQDHQVTRLIQAGNRTLNAVADRDVDLKAALTRLPSTLKTTRAALGDAATFATELRPTARQLTPALQRLPATLRALTPFARQGTQELADHIRPFVRRARPLGRELGRAVPSLRTATTPLRSILQVATYALNELAYNPKGDDEGMLFWGAWFAHNSLSVFSSQDAHGSLGRIMVYLSCQQLVDAGGLGDLYKAIIGVADPCPAK